MPTKDEPTEPTMNDRLRLKPPPHDVFAKYHAEDTDTTEPKDDQ